MIAKVGLTRPQGNEAKETAVIVDRLQQVVADYIRPAASMGLTLQGGDVAGVIRQLAERTERGEGVPPFAQTPEGYFLQGLYEELAQEQVAIFEKAVDAEGKESFRPISGTSWQLALDLLAARLR